MIMGLASTIAALMVLIFGKYADAFGLIQMAKVSTIIVAATVLISPFIPIKYVKSKRTESNLIVPTLDDPKAGLDHNQY
jgi:hypothetical protein